MNFLNSIAESAGNMVRWLAPFFGSLTAVLGDLVCVLFGESLNLSWGILAAIPVPAELANFQLPTPGGWYGVLVQVGIPEALVILTAAFTIKMTMKLAPLLLA